MRFRPDIKDRRTIEQKLEDFVNHKGTPEHERAVAAKKLAELRAKGGSRQQQSRQRPPPGVPVTAAGFARTYGLNPRKFRKKLRAMGKNAPYSWEDMETARNMP